MTLMQSLKRICRKLTPAEMAASELGEAELAKLQSQTGQEYAASLVQYHDQRITRLRKYLKSIGETV